jgi:hypothetical protein
MRPFANGRGQAHGHAKPWRSPMLPLAKLVTAPTETMQKNVCQSEQHSRRVTVGGASPSLVVALVGVSRVVDSRMSPARLFAAVRGKGIRGRYGRLQRCWQGNGNRCSRPAADSWWHSAVSSPTVLCPRPDLPGRNVGTGVSHAEGCCPGPLLLPVPSLLDRRIGPSGAPMGHKARKSTWHFTFFR